jgi:prepilin-type N-terminal cleavage/methylation domain-containing protein
MIKKLQKLKNKQAFTLIEIIVVLVILAILVAIALPVMFGYVEEARAKSMAQEVRVGLVAAQWVVSEYAMTARGITTRQAAEFARDAINTGGTLSGVTVPPEITNPGDAAERLWLSFRTKIDGVTEPWHGMLPNSPARTGFARVVLATDIDPTDGVEAQVVGITYITEEFILTVENGTVITQKHDPSTVVTSGGGCNCVAGAWTLGEAATCLAAGIEVSTCTLCGETMSQLTDLAPHDWEPDSANEGKHKCSTAGCDATEDCDPNDPATTCNGCGHEFPGVCEEDGCGRTFGVDAIACVITANAEHNMTCDKECNCRCVHVSWTFTRDSANNEGWAGASFNTRNMIIRATNRGNRTINHSDIRVAIPVPAGTRMHEDRANNWGSRNVATGGVNLGNGTIINGGTMWIQRTTSGTLAAGSSLGSTNDHNNDRFIMGWPLSACVRANITMVNTVGEHNYGAWVNQSTTQHRRTCSACNMQENVNHTWSDWTPAESDNSFTCGGPAVTQNRNCTTVGCNRPETRQHTRQHNMVNNACTHPNCSFFVVPIEHSVVSGSRGTFRLRAATSVPNGANHTVTLQLDQQLNGGGSATNFVFEYEIPGLVSVGSVTGNHGNGSVTATRIASSNVVRFTVSQGANSGGMWGWDSWRITITANQSFALAAV